VKFGDIAMRIGDASDPRKLESHVPYIGLEHMPRGEMFLDEWGTSKGLGSGKSSFKTGDVLFGRLRPYFKKVGLAPIAGVCSTDVLVLRPTVGESSAMVLALAASEEFIAYASAAATGTKMPRVSWDYLAAWETLLPSAAVTARFEEGMAPLLTRAIASIHERIALAQLRDCLLPELLSGRIRVKDAELLMESV
jgi:type I restriction enzyme S subunit